MGEGRLKANKGHCLACNLKVTRQSVGKRGVGLERRLMSVVVLQSVGGLG